MRIKNITLDGDLNYFGSAVVAPEEKVAIWTNGFSGIIGIVGIGSSSPSWTIQAITDMREAIISDRFTPIEADSGTEDYAHRAETGMSAYLVENKSKTKNMRVNWRIIIP